MKQIFVLFSFRLYCPMRPSARLSRRDTFQPPLGNRLCAPATQRLHTIDANHCIVLCTRVHRCQPIRMGFPLVLIVAAALFFTLTLPPALDARNTPFTYTLTSPLSRLMHMYAHVFRLHALPKLLPDTSGMVAPLTNTLPFPFAVPFAVVASRIRTRRLLVELFPISKRH
jgi:hypothetical protein